MSRYCVRCSVRAESMLSQVGLVLIMQGRGEESRGRKEVGPLACLERAGAGRELGLWLVWLYFLCFLLAG